MAGYLKRENRRDTKWAHPESVSAATWIVPGLMDHFYHLAEIGPETAIAERIEIRKVLRDQYLENESAEEKSKGEWKFLTVPGCPEEPETETDMIIRLPKTEGDELRPCVFEIPGGGLYAAGSGEFIMDVLAYTSEHHNAVVVSPCYRLCVEAPYPASVNDCHAAYQYILEHAQELKIDTSKIVIHGYSSGGHMALCLGFRLKRYGIKARGIVASLPVVDDVNATQSGAFSYYNEENGSIEAWDGEAINATMQLWLKGQTGNPMLPPEAVPNRATVEDCIGYPPIWSAIPEMDASRDAALELMRKMHKANVFADYRVWGGCNHNIIDNCLEPTTPLGKLVLGADHYNIDQAIKYDFSRPWTER